MQNNTPKLNADGTPQTGSPVIGLGANLTSLGLAGLLTDKAGHARPSSGTWDVGAYQYTTTEIGRMKDEIRNQNQVGWVVLPNPIKAALVKQYQQKNKDLKIYNLTGKAVEDIEPDGIYLVQLNTFATLQKVAIIK